MLAPQDTASELQRRYAVWGKYYTWHGAHSQAAIALPMRSHLELFAQQLDPLKVIQGTPDAVAIMMNPGSSEPLPSMQTIAGFVPAKPDTTQYQLMRVMQALNWKHVRVINLSDYRAPKSKDFVRFLHDYAHDDSHSIFSSSRSEQLHETLGECPRVILGWGVQPVFETWARAVITAVAGRQVLGQAGKQDWIYKHPLPLAQPQAQLDWVAHIVSAALAH